MKNLMKYIPAILFLALVTLASCGSDSGDGDGGDTTETGSVDLGAISTDLSGEWAYDTHTPSDGTGADLIVWDNLTLTIAGTAAGGTFTTTGQPTENNAEALVVWPASGTWDFSEKTDATTTVLDRSDNVEVTVSSVTDTQLVVSFTLAEDANVRAGEIDGGWSFTFTKQ